MDSGPAASVRGNGRSPDRAATARVFDANQGEPVTTATASPLPAWAVRLRDLFKTGSAAQFILHGNVFDLVPAGSRLLSLKGFLDEVMFAGYDVVLHYDRSRGVRATRGGEDWSEWLEQSLGSSPGAQTMTLLPEIGRAHV